MIALRQASPARQAGAVGVERTTRHACVAPRRLGSIRAAELRRRIAGTGPFDPDRTRLPRRLACHDVPL